MSTSPIAAREIVSDPYFPRLKKHIIDATGMAYYAQKDDELATRVARHMATLGLRECATYLTLLLDGKQGEAELDTLITDLTIGETFFFRHREQFDALRTLVLPDIIQRNQPSRRLRIWSAGCATGAEPYSLAILLKREFGYQLTGWEVSILGTDINREFLAHAQKGEFGEWAFRSAPLELKQACFTRSGQMWKIAPEFRQWVSFQYHNMVQHPFPSLVNNLFAFDLILCRNVMIYFDGEIIRRLLGRFYESLVDHGWLFVGHAEPNIEYYRQFRTVNAPGAVLYQKSQEPASADWLPPGLPKLDPVPPPFDWRSASGWTPPVLPPLTPVPAPAAKPKPVPPPRPAAKPPAELVTLEAVRTKADRGELEEADRCCQELIRKDQLNPLVHFYHALVLEQMGRLGETEQSLRRTIYLDRNSVLAHYHLGLLLQKKRDGANAQRSFRNVINLLEQMPETKVFADADGLTASALKQLTQMHLEVLETT